MPIPFLPAFLVLFAASAAFASEAIVTPTPTGSPSPRNLLIVGFREEAAATVRHSTRGDWRAELVRRRNGYEVWSLPVEFKPGSAALALREIAHVAWAAPLKRLEARRAPNDPYFVKNAGSPGACPPDQWGALRVDLARAWDYTQGSRDIVLAIVDSGISHSHPQLTGRFWTNPGEVPGNQLDDDGNGYIDDQQGFDFAGDNPGGSEDDPLSEDPEPDVRCGTSTPCDPSVGNGLRDTDTYSPFPPDAYASHGTMAAGLIAARADDHSGYAGMDWYCRIMDLRAGNAEGTAFNLDVADSIHYAIENGAQVIYLAFASPQPDPVVEAAVLRAIAQGIVVVTPAGNSGKRGVDHPAAMATPAGIIGVAASDRQDELALVSSFGVGVDLMAPGSAIRGPGIVSVFQATATPQNLPGAPRPDGECPVPEDGTSWAAAYTAGAACLLLAFDPQLSPARLGSALVAGSDRIRNDRPGRPRYGRLNVAGAIQALQSFTPTPVYHTPTETETPTITETPTVPETPTPTETATVTPPPSFTTTGTLTPGDTPTPTGTPTPSRSPTPTPNPKDASISVFPDPARGKNVTFRFRVPAVSELNLEVYDRYGAPVTYFDKTAEGWVDFVLPTKGLHDGIYTYHATARNVLTGKQVHMKNRKFVVIKDTP